MNHYFESMEQLNELIDHAPMPWEVTELELEEDDPEWQQGVTFKLPISTNLIPATALEPLVLELIPDVDWHFFPDEEGSDIFTTGWSFNKPKDEEQKYYIEVDMMWPIPNNIVPQLEEAAEFIVDAVYEEAQPYNKVPFYL